MAAEPVKIPLAVKKALKDGEPKKLELLKEISEIVGVPVTVNFNVEAAFTALAGNANQNRIGDAMLGTYLEATRDGFRRQLKDCPLTKAVLLKHWTTKVLTFTIEKDGFKPKAGEMATGDAQSNYYNGWRITPAGDLDIYIMRWFSNVDNISQVKFTDLLENAPGDLSLQIQKDLVTEKDKIAAITEKITKATGVAATWDIVADLNEFAARKDIKEIKENRRHGVRVDFIVAYMTAVANCLEKACADDMVKEAVADVFKGKVSFKLIPDQTKGAEIDPKKYPMSIGDNYGRLQLDAGEIKFWVIPGNWGSNVDNITQYNKKLVDLF